MKSVTEILSQRVTCRRYQREPLTDSQREDIFAAIRNTPTSFNAQNYTVIYIDDQEKKLHLYDIIGQKQIKTCAAFLVFCTDFHKIEAGAAAKGVEMPSVYNTLDGVIDGTINASLAMMSALITAESLGLGTCPIGYARTVNPKAVAEALNLPPHVMAVCGLAIGIPNEHHDLKPKQPDDLLIHHNTYRTEGIAEDIIDYDTEIIRYNETREGGTTDNDWVKHITDYYREMLTLNMMDKLRPLGFDVKN